MCPIKFPTKPIFRIFHILKINRIMPFCNLFMGRPSYNEIDNYHYSNNNVIILNTIQHVNVMLIDSFKQRQNLT